MTELKKYLKKYNIVVLLVTVFLSFNLINPVMFNNKLSNKSPQGFLASDNYIHLGYVYHIVDNGYYKYQPKYMTGDQPEDVQAAEPPLCFYIAAYISKVFNIPPYDGINLAYLILLFGCLCCVYLISNKIHYLLPYFSLPATILQFAFPFNSMVTWGFWKFGTAAIMLLMFIVLFLNTKRTIKNSLFFGILLSMVFISHPTIIYYVIFLVIISYIYDIIKDRKLVKSGKFFLSHLLIGLVCIPLCLDFYINISISRMSSNLLHDLVRPGYHLYGATPYVSHLGMFFWFSLLGFIIYYLFLKKKDSEESKKTIIILMVIFIGLLGPLYGYDRIYQFRLVWPLFIAVTSGIPFLLLVSFIPKKQINLRLMLSVGIFVLLSFYIYNKYMPSVRDANGQTYSIVDDRYWDALNSIRYSDARKVLLIDPTLTQDGVVISTGKYTRFLDANAAHDNVGIDGELKIKAGAPRRIRTSFFGGEENYYYESHIDKDLQMDLCTFDIILIRKAAFDQESMDWLNSQLELIQLNINPLVVRDDNAVLLLRNDEVC